ncbi:uncharacterized protein LOC132943065 [Metopolophium dirhodum]|uniref:uncharacterized protein LOC132943065 n=1 Tax=Metopolophium dirhodum TaxID=44670 RepID=UPI00299066EF|nr:uncharacterized protein LOC132943065 [Metopolophium dirhodum]
MNFLSIVLVIALVGYSLGAPQYSHYELDDEYEHVNPEPRYNSVDCNCNGQEHGDSQEQDEGTREVICQGRDNKKGQGRYRKQELGGYHTPEQKYYANNPGYGFVRY